MLHRIIDSCLVVSIPSKLRKVLPTAGAGLCLSSDRLWDLFFPSGLVCFAGSAQEFDGACILSAGFQRLQELPVQRFTNVRLELFLCDRDSMASVRSLDIEKKEESQSFR
jgi:hypothetical protein